MLRLLLHSYTDIVGVFPKTQGTPSKGMDYFNAIQNSFEGGIEGLYLIFGCLAATVVTVLITNAMMCWQGAQASRICEEGEPEELFKSLLKEVDLDEEDKQTLQEIAAGARLRHPATMLLSPGLLNWSRHLCAQEEESALSPEKWTRIKEISHKLYDHSPTTNSKVSSAR